ncbi:hypothetical protein SeMB42_g03795 [Synchytrium endobioticum]|uniref:Uncharacterized protein n=1 Tax=Synchytrium endobioticum TaxID=286115 RepID=A0A507D4H9_9FUNG|nr:hypothetical protein SeMB42_g03795 [Synchytrium endobioticum]
MNSQSPQRSLRHHQDSHHGSSIPFYTIPNTSTGVRPGIPVSTDNLIINTVPRMEILQSTKIGRTILRYATCSNNNS